MLRVALLSLIRWLIGSTVVLLVVLVLLHVVNSIAEAMLPMVVVLAVIRALRSR